MRLALVVLALCAALAAQTHATTSELTCEGWLRSCLAMQSRIRWLRCPVLCRCQILKRALAPSAAGCLQLADLLKLQLAKLEADPEKASDSNVPNDELVGDVGCEHP